MAAPTVCSPVSTIPQVIGDSAEVVVPEDELVFAGHYPGFPILPGVCVVEYVRLAALSVLDGRWLLSSVGSCRFLGPVFPGDRLDIGLSWSGEGHTRRCRATVTAERGTLAQMRLTFDSETP